MVMNGVRSRWAALGAAVAVSLGAGGIGMGHATIDSGDRAVYRAIEPCRLTDLRPEPDNVGNRDTPLGPDEAHTLTGWGTVGNCNLPAGTTALALNVTALGATQPTFLTLYPTTGTRPLSSNLNPAPGQPATPNAVNVTLWNSGEFDVYNLQGSVNVIIDVVGVFDHHTHDDRYYTKTQIDARRASSISVHAAAFVPETSDTGYELDAREGIWATATPATVGIFHATVALPNGVKITGLSAVVYDDVLFNGNVRVTLTTTDIDDTDDAELLGATSVFTGPSYDTISASPPPGSEHVVDNTTRLYVLTVGPVLTDWETVKKDLRLKSVTIEFEHADGP